MTNWRFEGTPGMTHAIFCPSTQRRTTTLPQRSEKPASRPINYLEKRSTTLRMPIHNANAEKNVPTVIVPTHCVAQVNKL